MPFKAQTGQGSFFSVKVDGLKIGLFSNVGGLSIEVDVAEDNSNNEGSMYIASKHALASPKYSEITLKHGLTNSMEIQKWFNECATKQVVRKSLEITIMDLDLKPVATFNFSDCWPTKLSIGDLSATSNDIVVEEITMVHEHLEWAK